MKVKARPVKGLEQEYVVTNNGRVFRRLENGYNEISPATNEDGYKTVVLYKNSKPHFKYIHELVAENWLDQSQIEDYINHKDGDKTNNHVDNLAYANAQENTQHAYDKGLAKGPKGEINGKSKLTKSQVQKIKKSDQPGNKLASLYNVTPATISLIKNNKRW